MRTAPASASAREHPDTGFVTAPDGTTIGYRRLGRGPGLVLLHGSMSTGYNHRQLAEALADDFTVVLPDRRGRGLSGPYRESYSIQRDVEDLGAVLSSTGASNVCGVSSGAIIVLQAALGLPGIRRAALFEPPLFLDESVPAAVQARFDREMHRGDVAAALVTAMKGSQMGPRLFNAMPRRLLEALTRLALRGEARKAQGEYVPMRVLASTLHHEFELIAAASGRFDAYRALSADVLLLGGGKSPAYLKSALDALEPVLPRAYRVELPGVGHAASWNADRGGTPGLVARELRKFFGPT
jgi:pimeloyl-ACP methyl ester carboxylesterase